MLEYIIAKTQGNAVQTGVVILSGKEHTLRPQQWCYTSASLMSYLRLISAILLQHLVSLQVKQPSGVIFDIQTLSTKTKLNIKYISVWTYVSTQVWI